MSPTLTQRWWAQAQLASWQLWPPRLFSGLWTLPLYRETLLSWALPGLEPGQRVLELGCASGELSQAMAAHGAAVTAIDRSAAMVARTRRRVPPVQAQQADALALPPPAAPGFDLVLAASLLNLVDHPPALLTAMAGQARPGGRLALLVPHADFDDAALHKLLASHPRSTPLEHAALRTWHQRAPKLSTPTIQHAVAAAHLPPATLRLLLHGLLLSIDVQLP